MSVVIITCDNIIIYTASFPLWPQAARRLNVSNRFQDVVYQANNDIVVGSAGTWVGI